MLPVAPEPFLLLEPCASLIDTAVILNGKLYVCLRARQAIHPNTLVRKGAVNTGTQLFDKLIVSESTGNIM